MKAVPANRYYWFGAISAFGCLTDLPTKSWIFSRLGEPPAPTWWLWEGVFGFQTSLNPGALFGMGRGMWWLFSTLSVVAAVGIIYWLFVVGAARDRLLNLALACVMGGILGNLYDRLGLGFSPDRNPQDMHSVRDWILFQVKFETWSFTWPNFNIADSLLVCGAGMLILHAIKSDSNAPDAKPDPGSKSGRADAAASVQSAG